jgi:hypothetical protein
MVQGYYNLAEAAQVLGMSAEELRGMAQRNQIRSFQDRGTLRFRMQDVQELARRRGASSDPGLPFSAEPKSGPRTPVGPKSGPKSPPKTPPRSPKPAPADAPEVFSFALEGEDQLDIGHEVLSDAGSRSGSKSGPKSGPKPPAGSDSDVKLVSDKGPDSDVRLVGDTMGPRTPKVQRKSQLGPVSPAPKKSGRIAGGAEAVDSGVRLVPMDSDSDVKIVGAGSGEDIPLGAAPPPSATDSDIRLERVPEQPAPSSHDMMLTDEINLDEEIKKQEAAQRKQPKSRVRPKQEPKFPTESPFELSDSDINASTEAGPGAKRPSSSDFELTPKGVKDDSSDFDLTPAKGSSVLEPDSGSDFSLELPDDAIDIGESGVQLTGPSSGISLSNPVDAGISLEDAGSSDSVDLNLDVRGVTAEDSGTASSSEFELSLEDSGQGAAHSDSSEFELTLDDSGANVPALDGLQAKSGERDIFETDFEVPSLEDESGSEVAALETSDTDLESSDFDLALDDSDLAVEDESGSQVVALDEESADEAAETIAGELGEELDIGEEAEEEEEEATGPVREVVRERIIEPAPWGALPVVFMLPCVIVMLVVGIMGYELVQSSAGFRSAGFLTKTLGELVGQKMR